MEVTRLNDHEVKVSLLAETQALTASELEQLMRKLAQARSQIAPRVHDVLLNVAMQTVQVFPLLGYSPVAIPEERQIELFLMHPGLGLIGMRLEASQAFEFSARLDSEIAKMSPSGKSPTAGQNH
jgi:hypothetical protein